MRKIITFSITLTLLILLTANPALSLEKPPSASADGVILMDANTGTILYSKNENAKYPPASTTKIMTALLTLENCNLDTVVTIGKNPPQIEGSSISIFENEKLTIRDLLYGLLLQSGNDCATALAEHISGSVEEFAKLMNNRAKELGCKNTTFKNPHGLYDPNHRTTAYDLALILRELIKYPEYKKISTAPVYHIPPTNQTSVTRYIWNQNRLIQKNSKSYYPACEGGKKGYTDESKHSFVSVASKNKLTLIATLVHDPKKTYWSDVVNLFEYGFKNFSLETLHSKGDSLGKYSINQDTKVPIMAVENFSYVKDKTSSEKPKIKINTKDLSQVSFKKGDIILDANVIYKNKTIGKLKIASAADYNFEKSIIKGISNFKLAILIFVGFLFVLIVSLLLRKKSHQNHLSSI